MMLVVIEVIKIKCLPILVGLYGFNKQFGHSMRLKWSRWTICAWKLF